MVKHFDHVTVVVRDLEKAKAFFALLGFEQDRSVVISGERVARYMSVPGIEADHVTLVLRGASPGTPRTEVQLLHYRRPDALPDPTLERLDRVGFNHVCFAVDDLEALLARLRAEGVATRSEVMDFQQRKLVFLVGPEGITVELAQWE